METILNFLEVVNSKFTTQQEYIKFKNQDNVPSDYVLGESRIDIIAENEVVNRDIRDYEAGTEKITYLRDYTVQISFFNYNILKVNEMLKNFKNILVDWLFKAELGEKNILIMSVTNYSRTSFEKSQRYINMCTVDLVIRGFETLETSTYTAETVEVNDTEINKEE